ncbi:MFS transporter [Cupriavidus sp. DF5525]|uniref:MFS transporter n=1 Tax=Cupriavidus sp. DF5525 TaxID=3160989 RepID=UPI0032DFD15C
MSGGGPDGPLPLSFFERCSIFRKLPMQLPHGLRALSYPSFRLFMVGQGAAQVGNWQQLIATSWLAYALSGSTLVLGLAAFALQIPFLLMAPVTGPLLDRLDTRRVLMAANAVACAQSVVMLALVATGLLRPWHIVLANLVLGIVNAFDSPARQSLLSQMVDRKEDLANAIALNSSVMAGARFVGPTLAGALIATFGQVWAFAANAILRFAIIAALRAMRLAPAPSKAAPEPWLRQFAGGLRYAHRFTPCRNSLWLLATMSFTIQIHAAMMPWFVRERFHGDSRTLGMLLGAAGLGALAGMLYLATRRGVNWLLALIGIASVMAALATIGFAMAPMVWIAFSMLFLVGMGTMLVAASVNTLIQLAAPDGLRGRVASLYVVAFLGVSPVGALFWGWAAEHVGTPAALTACGVALLLASAMYMANVATMREQARPVYSRMNLS